MTNISKYHSVKVISAVMGFIVLSELAVAQDMGRNDSVSVRTEKADMPYKVKGRIIDAVTKKGFAGARVTTPNLNVSAMTDENGNYEIGVPDLSVALYVEACLNSHNSHSSISNRSCIYRRIASSLIDCQSSTNQTTR